MSSRPVPEWSDGDRMTAIVVPKIHFLTNEKCVDIVILQVDCDVFPCVRKQS
jgi:hypothetical protein